MFATPLPNLATIHYPLSPPLIRVLRSYSGSGAEVTFVCDAVACSSNKTDLIVTACKGVPSCGKALLSLGAQVGGWVRADQYQGAQVGRGFKS